MKYLPESITEVEAAELAAVFSSLGYNAGCFEARLTVDGGVMVFGPVTRALYNRNGWLLKFTSHLGHGFYGPP
jgi:hypothetical protein